ncbi:MAG: MFS transporter [Candidatus Thorarchaeota archaeon]|nr:MFS transporter [Candidatus Thorarchaeota archaeon]
MCAYAQGQEEKVAEEGDNWRDAVDKENQEDTEGIRESLRNIFQWKNYRIYLATYTLFSAFGILSRFTNLYLREIGWSFILLGIVITITSTVATLSRFIGGYIGDIMDRKNLAVIAAAMLSVYYLLIGISTEFIVILVGLLIYSLADLARGGSSAYIMDNMPEDNSGLALSLFTALQVVGVGTLIVLSFLVSEFGFGNSMRGLFAAAGIGLFISAVVRAKYLESSGHKQTSEHGSFIKGFIKDNKRAAKLVVITLPAVLVITVLDSFSDSLFNFGALIYTNEWLGVSIQGISIMLIVQLLVSVPLLLKMGQVADRSLKKAAIGVYSLMPISVLLLLLSAVIPYWAPMNFISSVSSILPVFEVVFSTPFLAIVLKYVSDAVWGLMLMTIIQKLMPREDTSKVLGVFWTIVYISNSLGPLLGSVLFTYLHPAILFILVLVLNIGILASITRNGLFVKRGETTQ